MSEEILINSTPSETRVALVENGMLQEVWLERVSHRGYIGNIYKGRVTNVEPSIQAAFVSGRTANQVRIVIAYFAAVPSSER